MQIIIWEARASESFHRLNFWCSLDSKLFFFFYMYLCYFWKKYACFLFTFALFFVTKMFIFLIKINVFCIILFFLYNCSTFNVGEVEKHFFFCLKPRRVTKAQHTQNRLACGAPNARGLLKLFEELPVITCVDRN